MKFVIALYAAVLFFILSPNVLVRLPKKGSTQAVAAVHAVIFGLVLFFSCRFVWQMSKGGIPPTVKEGVVGDQCVDNGPCDGGEICVENKCAKV